MIDAVDQHDDRHAEPLVWSLRSGRLVSGDVDRAPRRRRRRLRAHRLGQIGTKWPSPSHDRASYPYDAIAVHPDSSESNTTYLVRWR